MESRSARPCPHGGHHPSAVSAKRLRRAVRAVYLVLVKKHRPKLAALGVHLHRMLSNDGHRGERSALTYLSCRSMDPAAAVVHPLPLDTAGGGGHRRKSSSARGAALPSLSCRSMDPAAAVRQYQYRPREVQFSCKSTPPHKRRRARNRAQHLQYAVTKDQAGRDHPLELLECHGSAAVVTRLFELMDVEEEEASGVVDLDDDGELLDLEEAAAAWPALSSPAGPAPRQVRITDSPFSAVREEEEDGLVDERADEFITWFYEQLHTQQQCAAVTGRGAYAACVR